LVGLCHLVLAGDDAARLAIAVKAEHPGPCAIRLDTKNKALQRGIVDGEFAVVWPGREREGIG